MTSSAGLFPNQEPSKQILLDWLELNEVHVSDAIEIYESETGWGVRATQNIGLDELLLSVPKTSLLSARTTSLKLPRELVDPVPSDNWAKTATTNLTVPTLALILLHEIRLGEEGRYWGYVQSLPRSVGGLPIFWDEEGDARRWLRGTDAERELNKRKESGMGLDDLKKFYQTTKHLLQPTTAHPEESPLESYLYAYSLISTRAFLIDIYHTLALVPFADILNHSSSPHTSLASDDFVCHLCGSLAACQHDGDGIPERLAHVDPIARGVMEKEVDSVDMRSEREIKEGEEVFNSYGKGIGDARLLVEWGFMEGEFAGHGLEWDIDQVLASMTAEGADVKGIKSSWEELVSKGAIALKLFPDGDIDDDTEKLISPPINTSSDDHILNLNYNGQISLSIWIALFIICRPTMSSDTLRFNIIHSVNALERANRYPNPLDIMTRDTSPLVVSLLRKRKEGMYRPEMAMKELLDLRDGLPDGDEKMAMTLSIDERALLYSALNHWMDLLRRIGVRPLHIPEPANVPKHSLQDMFDQLDRDMADCPYYSVGLPDRDWM